MYKRQLQHDAFDGRNDRGKRIHKILTGDVFCYDNQDGIVTSDGANHLRQAAGIDVGSQTSGVARTRVDNGQIA